MKLKLIMLALLMLTSFSNLWAQVKTIKPILNDKVVMAQVKDVMDNINGYKFAKARAEIVALRKLVPDHPISDLLDGLTDYWEHYPVYAYEDRAKAYRTKLNACHEKSATMLEADENSIEGSFFTMMTDMMLAKHYSDRGESMTSLNYARKSFGLIKKGFNLKNQYVEFYFTTGLYDYFRVVYPNLNPVLKSFMWMFPDGDKKRGLEELEYAFNNSTFTRADAAVFLNRINLYFEQKPLKAAYYMGVICKEYPENPYYQLGYAEALLAGQNYKEALPIIQKLETRKEPFYQGASDILMGWYHELGDRNTTKANQFYVAGLDKAKNQKGRLYDNLKGIAYLGLARSWKQTGNKVMAQRYFKKAGELVAYPELKKEAQAND